MTMVLLVQCADCLGYFKGEWRYRGEKREYFVPGHECFIGDTPTPVEGEWFGDVVEELMMALHTIPDPDPPSAADPFDAEPF
jgi:hypothetical protein